MDLNGQRMNQILVDLLNSKDLLYIYMLTQINKNGQIQNNYKNIFYKNLLKKNYYALEEGNQRF